MLINYGTDPAPVRLHFSGSAGLRSLATIRSSESEDAAALPATPVSGGVAVLTLPPYSVVTLQSTCYANCDSSSAAPVLNVNDFVCFLNRFAAGDPYANCDGSTTPPVLNVADFNCFLNAFAAGCT